MTICRYIHEGKEQALAYLKRHKREQGVKGCPEDIAIAGTWRRPTAPSMVNPSNAATPTTVATTVIEMHGEAQSTNGT